MRKYPLDPLLNVRADKVERQTRVLADANNSVEAARIEAERRLRSKQEQEQRDRQIGAAERARLEAGELTVLDLTRGAAWRVAADRNNAAMAHSLDEARAEEARALDRAADERQKLAVSRADAEVVEKNRARWQAGQRAEVLAREEENAEEVHLASAQKGQTGRTLK